GQITAKTMITDRVKEGLVFMPFHFVESCANILTNPANDPVAKIPEFKVCAVNVERVAD
ncbi:MAG: molybdopterin dinucleotide binding domain-containing protein, partial [Desulfobacterales bacterium]|nr:molybdopterin dinucleotide binding domain-containing protein [Desulfobacterales bacterium]MDX2509115.1 molybdopterin dinucleotide binding domain-containing protein [Desulfobacterales bacterium]